MLSWAIILLIGFPCLISGIWFGTLAYQKDCIIFLIGPVQCGSSLYIYTFLGLISFAVTLWLAYLWRD